MPSCLNRSVAGGGGDVSRVSEPTSLGRLIRIEKWNPIQKMEKGAEGNHIVS